MDWSKVNLQDNYERAQNILDPLSFNILLLEIHCNIKDTEKNIVTITRQFEDDLQSRITSAREIFEANKLNILKESLK